MVAGQLAAFQQDFLEDGAAFVQLGIGEVHGRQQAEHGAVGAVDQQPALHARLDHGVPSTVNSMPIITPLTRTSWISGQRLEGLEALAKAFADADSRAQQAVLLDGFDGGQGGAQASGLPPKVAAWVPGLSFSATSGRAIRPPQATPPASGLGQRDDVGQHLPVLVRVPAAGPAHAGLHLVEDQQQLVLVGQLAQSFQVAGRRQVDAAFALDRLDQDGTGLAIDQPGHGLEVAEGGIAEAGQQRLDALVVLRLAGGGERAEGSAMEAVEHGDDLVAAGLAVQAGQLDGGLVRLGAAVAEEALAFPAGAFAEGLGQLALRTRCTRCWARE